MDAFRLLPYRVAVGACNMAADHVLLDAAAEHGVAALRFYGWTEPTLSLGYFQAANTRLEDPRRATLPWVRRPSGGKTLIHHHELTYALALPPGFDASWMARMHERVIWPALAELGLNDVIKTANRSSGASEALCFRQQTPGDLTCQGHKVVGSAQRKHRRALLQHGAILLAASEYAPELPGIRELAGVDLFSADLQAAIAESFVNETKWNAHEDTWTPREEAAIRKTANDVYGAPAWNEKR